MVYIILGNGFEETEATTPYDILRRGGVEAVFAGVQGRKVMSAHGIDYTAHCTVSDIDLNKAEMVVLPGGLGGVECIESSKDTLDMVKAAYDRGIEIAAICAGPRVLSRLGILKGRKATCYPGLDAQINGAEMHTELSVVREEKLTTGRGPGASFDFGFALLEVLRGKETADRIAGDMCFERK